VTPESVRRFSEEFKAAQPDCQPLDLMKWLADRFCGKVHNATFVPDVEIEV
jgi:hypothetical protein